MSADLEQLTKDLHACAETMTPVEAVGWRTSTKENTHAKPVAIWIGADFLDLGGEA